MAEDGSQRQRTGKGRTGDEGVAVARAGAKRTGLHEGNSWRQWHSSTRARLKVESETRARGKFTRVYYQEHMSPA